MPIYTLEERARARLTVRRLGDLSTDIRLATQRGLELTDAVKQAAIGLTKTEDASRQVEALQAMSDRVQAQHLAKLKPLAAEDFNAFCEYVEPLEPPESAWHIYLTGLLQRMETEPGNDRLVLNCPPGHAKPLSVDTLVLMGNGVWKRLGDIQVGEEVISHTGVPRKVLEVHEQGELDVLSIKTHQGREIIAAPDHSFRARSFNGKIVGAVVGEPEWKRADELGIGDLLELPVAQTTKVGPERLHLFRLAAYINAQSARSYSKDRHKKFNYVNLFLQTTDAALSARMEANLKQLHKKYTKWFGVDKLYHIRINTKQAEFLRTQIDIDALAPDRRTPAWVFEGSDKEVRWYIETLVDCLGISIKNSIFPRISLKLRSRGLAKDLQLLLTRFGIPCELSDLGPKSALLLIRRANLERYLKVFEFNGPGADVLAQRVKSARKTKYYPRVFATGAPLDSIKSITMADRAQCRCLTVDEDHTFVANGVIVHNSTYASRKFVAWRMGRRPNDKIIGGGHSQLFVENEFSGKIRSLVASPAYREIFPKIVIAHDQRAKSQWGLAGFQGQYVARGVGQGVHGFRAHFICVDDPYAKIEDAQSPAYRAKCKQWFFTDLGSRLLPGATIFLIMTRFHEEDLTSSVIEANLVLPKDARFKIIHAPAICYDPEVDILNRKLGEVLWDFYGIPHYTAIRATTSYQIFSLLYQQLSDASSDSSVTGKFRYYQTAPHASEEARRHALEAGRVDPKTGKALIDRGKYYKRVVATVDTATKAHNRADWSVIQIWAETYDRKHYLLDQKRERLELPDLTRAINGLAAKWDVSAILVEDKGNGSAYIQDQGTTDFQRRKAPAPVIGITPPSNQSKEFRFDEITPMIEAGEVFLPEQAAWLDYFIQEVGQFPEGANDDCVDAMTQYLRWAKTKRRRYGTKKITSTG